MKYNFEEMAKEARREVKYRDRVYRRLVDEGRMEEKEALERIAVMKQIARYFEELSQPSLL